MATTSGFKQQCPSCEAMVPIKDPGLIGRKIDCPKCKYRFVVEEPAETEEDEVEEVEEVGVKKGKAASAGKAGTAKAGPRRRRTDDDDDEDDDEPRRGRPKPAGGSNKGLLIGVGLGVIGLIIVAVVVVVMMNSGGDDATIASTPKAVNPRPRDDADDKKDEGERKEHPAAAAGTAGDVTFTNILPNDTEQVINVNLTELIKTPLGRAVYEPGGLFRKETLTQRLGIPADDIERIVLASSLSQGWSFNIVHTSKPIKMDVVKAALKLKPASDGPVQQQEYFVVESNVWLDSLSRQNPITTLEASTTTPPKPGPMGVRLENEQTLVFADLSVMKAFLTKKPEPLKPAESSTEKKSSDQPGHGGPPGQVGGGPMMSGGGGMGQSGGMGMNRPGMPGQPSQPAQDEAPTPSAGYLTVKPEIKAMLDRVEAKGALISLGTDSGKAINGLFQGVTKEWTGGEAQSQVLNLLLKPQLEQIAVLGLSMNWKDGVTVVAGMEFKAEDAAKRRNEALQKVLPQIATFLGEAFGLSFETPAEQQGSNFPPGMTGPPGMVPPGMGPPGFAPPSQGQGGMGARKPGARGGGGTLGDDDGGAFAPGLRRPGGTNPSGGDQANEPGKVKSSVQTALSDKTLSVTVNFVLDNKAHETFMGNHVRPALSRRKGLMDMAGARPRAHELAAALKQYVEANRQFPRGTFDRKVPSARAGRPYPPGDRVSWMADLLGLLGQEDLQRRIDVAKSWRDKENLAAAISLVPHFIDPHSPQTSWWVRYGSTGQDVATTQFVAIAGVGLDAAEYAADDPAVEKKLGIFGYDRVTKVADIKDKPAETIALIQVPPSFKRPWLAGGGSTVVGVPETGSIRPFVTTQPDGKRGALAIMGDGTVRFLSENITDDAFKALCTIKGGEEVQLNRDAKLVPAPEIPADDAPAEAPAAAGPTKLEPRPDVPEPKVEPPAKPVEPTKPTAGANNEKALAMMTTFCAQCHTGPQAKGKFQLFTQPGVLNQNLPNLKQSIKQVIAEGKMPPRKAPKHPNQNELGMLQEWLQAAN